MYYNFCKTCNHGWESNKEERYCEKCFCESVVSENIVERGEIIMNHFLPQAYDNILKEHTQSYDLCEQHYNDIVQGHNLNISVGYKGE